MNGLTGLIDSHCHLDHPRLDKLRETIWRNCLGFGVAQLVIPGTHRAQWPRLIEFCDQQPSWHLALGLHPYFIEQHQPDDLQVLERLIRQKQPIAIGEIGLDYSLPNLNECLQQQLLVQQLIIARSYRLPVILHARRSHDALLQILRRTGFSEGGIVHAFNGSFQQAEVYLALGFKLGFGGALTYSRAHRLHRLVRALPLTALVLETDAPDMPMAHQQDRLNRPDHLPYVFDCIVKQRIESPVDIARQIRLNTIKALRI